MAKITETELRRKLKKLEVSSSGSGASIEKVGDQYEYDKTVIYLAYASALSNLSSGTIPSQSDATDFQFSPYNDSGVLLAYRGYFINKSIYQSGDPTDYTWESTSGISGFTSSERYYTESTGLQNTLGNPTKPGTDITWTVINAGTAVPGTAVYLAERFTLTTSSGAVTSNWDISAVGKHVDSNVVAANAITSDSVNAGAIVVEKIDLDGTLNVTANSGAIRWGKLDGDDTNNTGLFLGRNSSGDPRMVFGNALSFIHFDGTTVSVVGADVDDSDGTNEVFYSDTSTTHRYTIGPNIATINIQMVGGGGGGQRAGTLDSNTPMASVGGTTTIVVKQSNGSTRQTFTAAGGAAGGGSGVGGDFAAGEAGDNFVHPGGGAHASFAGTGGAGGAYNTFGVGQTGGTGAGGGGQGQGGSGSAAHGGEGGEDATFYTTTYTVVNTTDYLDVTVGAGGSGQHTAWGNQNNVRGGGDGGIGRVRLQGAT